MAYTGRRATYNLVRDHRSVEMSARHRRPYPVVRVVETRLGFDSQEDMSLPVRAGHLSAQNPRPIGENVKWHLCSKCTDNDLTTQFLVPTFDRMSVGLKCTVSRAVDGTWQGTHIEITNQDRVSREVVCNNKPSSWLATKY